MAHVGDQAWEVDWCASIPVDENGDRELDCGDYRSDLYPSKAAADRRACEVLPLDAFGCVSVTAVEFVAYDEADAARYPSVGFWEATSEPEYYD